MPPTIDPLTHETARRLLERPPGPLVNAHTHLYSALAPWLPLPKTMPSSFVEILGQIWWRLDRALDGELLSWSARAGIADAMASGVTCVIDHHESPNLIEGSLDILADALEEAGMRGVVCYGITARNGGEQEWRRGLAENVRFLRNNRRKRVRGLVGVHACFTVPDEALQAAARAARDLGVGLHLHVAEDAVDRDAVARLRAADALVPGSVYAHCIHVTPDEVKRLAETGWVVQNPRSNRNNGVGSARHAVAEAAGRAALGTDGWNGGPLAETLELQHQAQALGEPADPLSRLAAGAALCRALFGESLDGDHCQLAADSEPPGYRVDEVTVAGEALGLSFWSEEEIRAQAARLWQRMEALI